MHESPHAFPFEHTLQHVCLKTGVGSGNACSGVGAVIRAGATTGTGVETCLISAGGAAQP